MNAPNRRAGGGNCCTLENSVGLVLRIGMVASIVVLVIGIIFYSFKPSETVHAVPLNDIPLGIVSGNPVALISIGILMLISTPVAAIIVATVSLAKNREWVIAGIGLIVIAILFISFILATV